MLSLAVAVGVLACGQGLTDPNMEAAHLEIEASQIKLLAGGDTQLSATVRNRGGQVLPGAAVRWWSDDEHRVRVRGTGASAEPARLHGEAVGSGIVSASAGVASDSTEVVVVDSSDVADIGIVTPPARIAVGEVTQLEATALDTQGGRIRGATFRWSSSDTSVATVSDEGRLEPRSAGVVRITAAYAQYVQEFDLDVTAGQDAQSSLPAFPGAEGFGALALNGCRGLPVAVHHVTAASGSGPGSLYSILRNHVADNRFDIVLFDIGGTMVIDETPNVKNSCVYIAGQTAPGDGVQITNDPSNPKAVGLRIRRYDGMSPSDIVVRYLRLRPGKADVLRGAWQIGNGHDVVIDHVSVTFSNSKEEIWTHAGEGDVRNVTIQWSTNAATLAPSSLGVLVGSAPGAPSINGISFHHNLFAHNGHRNPLVKNPARSVEVVNNVIYNWGSRAGFTSGEVSVDFINNYYKKGPASGSTVLGHQYVLNDELSVTGWNNSDPRYLYTSGNVVNPEGVLYRWSYFDRSGPTSWTEPAVTAAFVDEKQTAPKLPVNIEGAYAALSSVLREAGASASLSCDGRWVPAQDELDRRIASDVENGFGPRSDEEKDHQDDFGGYPDLQAGAPCADADDDGMPDAFEERFGLTMDADDSALDRDGDGYLNIEEYLNGTNP